MTSNKVKATSALALIVLVSSVSLALAMSIEREPVKVTHRNSGPKYDIDEDKLTPTNPENEQPSAAAAAATTTSPNSGEQEEGSRERPLGGVRLLLGANGRDQPADQQQDDFPIGHMTIRRIFLVPMMSPRQEGEWTSSTGAVPQQEAPSSPANPDQEAPASPFFPRPLWPFSLAPARHGPQGDHHHRHLLGQDEASRSPNSDNLPAASGEREGERPTRPAGPLIDPIQMMMEMMQQAINGQFAPPRPSPPQQPGDLSTNEASSRPTGEPDSNKPAADVDRPMRPSNETKEEVVDIDGKKYLRKTIISRHVGENIIFMTKRLIFTPLNETDSNEATTTTTTTSTTLKPSEESSELPSRPSSSPTTTPAAEEVSTSTTTPMSTTTPTTAISETSRTEQPAEVSTTGGSATSEEPMTTSSSTTTSSTTTTTEQPEETTTTASAKDLLDTVNKAAERLTGSTLATIVTN